MKLPVALPIAWLVTSILTCKYASKSVLRETTLSLSRSFL